MALWLYIVANFEDAAIDSIPLPPPLFVEASQVMGEDPQKTEKTGQPSQKSQYSTLRALSLH